MKFSISHIRGVFILLACLSFLNTVEVSGDEIFVPDYLWKRGIAEKSNPVDIADAHLRIPYRDDGVLDENGYFTTFARKDIHFDSPGLNCSGLVLSVCQLEQDTRFHSVGHDHPHHARSGYPSGAHGRGRRAVGVRRAEAHAADAV